MKLGVIADVHANLPALEAVLGALAEQRCLRIICLGDIVGYGPHPHECIALLQQRKIPCLMGNHDFWASSDLTIIGCSELARHCLLWTRQQLTADDKAWLAALPRRLDYAGVDFVHASCQPCDELWPYIKDEKQLALNFKHQRTAIAFCGHTHIPTVGVCDHQGNCSFIKPTEHLTLPKDHRVLINPGAVGQPRDHDFRAAAACLELRDRSLTFLRVPYDLVRTLRDLAQKGLDPRLAERLALGR